MIRYYYGDRRMKVLCNVLTLLFILLTVGSCKKDDEINVPLNSEINEFVWQGMKTYYFWQSEIPDLSDDKFTTFNELHIFLNGYNTPALLFKHLLFEDDRFSWIVDDYEELDHSFQGISNSFGYEFGLVKIGSTENIVGYVEYVIEGSPAHKAGLIRGDIFYAVDGNELNESNFRDLLFEQDTYTLSLGNFVSIEEGVESNGKSVSMTAIRLTENPILLTKIFNLDGVKVGYLVYNQFINTFHSELNVAFAHLKQEGVTEMILDLRYNPGGSVLTSQMLASMFV